MAGRLAIGVLLAFSALSSARAEAPDAVRGLECLPLTERSSRELRDLAAAIEILSHAPVLDGYYGAILRDADVGLCVDTIASHCRGYYEPESGVIAVAGGMTQTQKVLTLAHELRHLAQARAGFSPSLRFDMRENVRQAMALEADAQAIVTLFAWEMREAGEPELWAALNRFEHCDDIARAFAQAMAGGADRPAATLAAFSAWYRSEWRLARYRDAAATGFLDQLDESHAIPRDNRLPDDHFETLCLLPGGGNYGCHLTPEIAQEY